VPTSKNGSKATSAGPYETGDPDAAAGGPQVVDHSAGPAQCLRGVLGDLTEVIQKLALLASAGTGCSAGQRSRQRVAGLAGWHPLIVVASVGIVLRKPHRPGRENFEASGAPVSWISLD